ncbi:MAG: RNA polymerase sigma factor [Lentisphaerae bacterium]|nr:RNA polymerase sigma factor [Lentisphaerota bacterium]
MTFFYKGGKRKHEKFEAVVGNYELQLLTYVSRITGNPSSTEDIVQETFIKLASHWKGELEVGPKVSAWLYKVAHNEAIDFIRREKRRAELHLKHSEDVEQSAFPSEGQGGGQMSAEAVRVVQALEKLSERDRKLVVLKVYEERTYKDIAEMTGLSVSNVGFILHSAIKKLAQHLSEKRKEEQNGE